ncbi:hypothetical protein AL073_14955 [Loktanella sp. 1ANDIMAR09]|uniref:Uncharacterized protein n=1 Tax=Maritimibacter alkaliphilus HTCC2654 TaxID=314271 RepID=A3VJA2_9RHOB|nr:hypothetical protein RB2654_22518 [Rhodobacterales bacterium HTCC2654] [Maritimibacter alkaliphilus HTCC2654]KQB95532.1 hypothetical protein AL073_14955 [Loktanella sp. 1ANDIMAR09]
MQSVHTQSSTQCLEKWLSSNVEVCFRGEQPIVEYWLGRIEQVVASISTFVDIAVQLIGVLLF